MIANLQANSIWDIVIIGGGATGLGAAIEATTKGYKTLLLEQYDFVKATSSRSTKLVHGGVRYLAQGNISLVLEALHERGLLRNNAPHLVSNISFVIPSYSWWTIPFYTIGLTIYDLLSGKLSFGKSKPESRHSTIEKIPTIVKKHLRGGILYHDGQFDDSRMGINMAQTIIDNNGTAINYMEVTDLLKANSNVSGVVCVDKESGIEYNIKAKAVVNASGVFVDSILQKDNPSSRHIVKPSQGVHLILDREFLPSDYGLMIPKTRDGRILFALPWYNKIIIGTTDVEKDNAEIEPKATESEVDFILETAGRYLEMKPKRSDVRSVFAGLRPLAAPSEEGKKTKEISRSHKIYESKSGLITVIGGKWTTYRQMGVDIINKAEKVMKLPGKKSVTENLHLHGYKADTNFNDPLHYYGSDIIHIEELIEKTPDLADWLSEDLKINKAMVVWAVREEMARRLEDVLARRTRALFLDAAESIRIASAVANIMAEELSYDDTWINNQVTEFTKLAKGYLLDSKD